MKGIVIFLSIFIFSFFSFDILTVNAETVFQTPAPISSSPLQKYYSSCCSFEDNYNEFPQIYYIPQGITFSKIQFSAQPVSNMPSVYVILYQDVPPYIDTCGNTDTCRTGDINLGTLAGATTQYYTDVSDTAIEGNLATTTVTLPRTYIDINFGATFPTFTLDRSMQFNYGNYTYCSLGTYASVSCTESQMQKAVSMKLCNNQCDNNYFSPLPNVTATPWARLVSPQSSSTVPYTVPLNFEINWGTTTDNAIIRYSSNFQNIIPDNITQSSSGLQPVTFTKNFPAIDDTIQISIELLNGSTSIYTSPTYQLSTRDVTTAESIIEQNSPTACLNPIVSIFCSVATFLFIPSNFSLTILENSYNTLFTRKPFTYFTQTTTIISTIASSTSATSSFPNLTVTISPLPELTILSQSSLDAIYPESTRLYVRDIISYGLWIAFSMTIIYLILNIFNRVAYQGEQQQQFENRVKTRHER